MNPTQPQFPVRLLVGLLLAAMLNACSQSSAPPAPPPPAVTVATPHTETVTNWDEYPGHVEAVETVELRPRVSGYIDSIHFQDGVEVKVGDLLFVIDPRPYQALVDQAAAERQRAETRLELARNDFKRAEALHAAKAISDEEVDTRSKAMREAESALLAARASESSALLNLGYTRVTAPINGRIGRRIVTVGNLVQGGGMVPGTLLGTLVSMDPVYCYFDVDEPAFQRYRKNLSNVVAGSSMPCELAWVNEDGFPHKGRIDFFDNVVDAKTGTIRMRGVFANADRALVPGMFARVRVPAGPPVQALMIPAAAIGSDQGQKYVFVVNKENVIEQKSIQVDRQHGLMRAVTEGLTTEDRVVVNGLMLARPGVKVVVTEPAAKETPAAAGH